MLQSLSIITITYNNPKDLVNTYKSLKAFRQAGGTHIIINGGETINDLVNNDCVLIEKRDKGIYDALNNGIELVQTEYFMLVHSGDFLVTTIETLKALLTRMHNEKLDLLLNDCSLEFGTNKRIMKSSKWKPWMLKFGAQPPHPPTIYKTKSMGMFSYDLRHPVIADFKYLEDLFRSKLNWGKGNQMLIHMSAGGATSSGIKSFFYVNKQFWRLKGPLIMIWFALTRPLIKVYQMI